MGTTEPFAWSAHLLRAFHRLGLRRIVLSPGSRSTPLALAAKAHAGFEVTVVIDERSAGYVALGMAKHDGRPALLICTSGTALANYAPAAWEARMAGVPMVILSADRPPHHRATGSSQTIDHLGALGSAPVFFHECGEPRSEPEDLRRLAFAAYQATETSQRIGGAAHLNLPFRKPFEPTPEEFERERARNREQMEDTSAAHGAHDAVRTTAHIRQGVAGAAWTWIRDSRRPLLVMGALNPTDPLIDLPTHLRRNGIGIPVLAEPGGQPHSSDWISSDLCGPLSLDPSGGFEPDLLIRIGKAPTSASALNALERWSNVPLIHLSHHDQWEDPFATRSVRILADSAEEAAEHLRELAEPDKDWETRWRKADVEWRTVLGMEFKGELRSSASENGEMILDDLGAMHHVLASLPERWPVYLSNSLIPRDAGLLSPLFPTRRFISHRGAAGIDGILSSAIGFAMAQAGNTSGAGDMSHGIGVLIGDIAFLHDSNALLLHHRLNVPVVIAVINNGGGTIFRSLPIFSTYPEIALETFETPQSVDIAHLCKAHGIRHLLIRENDAQLSERIEAHRDTFLRPGLHVVEFNTDPAGSYQRRDRIRKALKLRLDALSGNTGR